MPGAPSARDAEVAQPVALVVEQLQTIDLAHNVSVPPGETGVEGNRLSQYFLRILDAPEGTDFDYPFHNESAFCSPVLLAP